jgi:hypothetical protein
MKNKELDLYTVIQNDRDKTFRFKGTQAWDIRDQVIYTEWSHLGWWLEEWTKKSICVNCWVDIPHFAFLAMTEYS